jgi:pimeloyl-ACP methyl ester carboxylesterase
MLCDNSAGPPRTKTPDVALLLHGSVSNGAMWRALTRALPAALTVVAPDLIGYGKSAMWRGERPFRLDHERSALAALLPRSAEAYHLVGHSYGGLVALDLALADPARVRTLTLIEPVFVAGLRREGEMAAYEQFRRVRNDFVSLIAADEREAAMCRFIDFWTGDGAWAALSPSARAESLRVADKVELDWEAAFAADLGTDRLRALASRTLLIGGDRSPEPMRRLLDVLHGLMPGSHRMMVPGANHLLPLTHGAAVNAAIAAHLADGALRGDDRQRGHRCD